MADQAPNESADQPGTSPAGADSPGAMADLLLGQAEDDLDFDWGFEGEDGEPVAAASPEPPASRGPSGDSNAPHAADASNDLSSPEADPDPEAQQASPDTPEDTQASEDTEISGDASPEPVETPPNDQVETDDAEHPDDPQGTSPEQVEDVDPDAMLGEIQDAVAAAIEEAAEEVGEGDQPAPQDDVADDRDDDASPPAPADDAEPAPAAPSNDADADEAMAALAADLEASTSEKTNPTETDAEPIADTEPTVPDDAALGIMEAATDPGTFEPDQQADPATEPAASSPSPVEAPGADAPGTAPTDPATSVTPVAAASTETAPIADPPDSWQNRVKTLALVQARDLLRPAVQTVSSKVGSLISGVLESLAVQYAAQPKVVRQSMAWVALWTLFNAGVLWGYLVLFRSGTPAPPPDSTTQIAEQGADAGTRPSDETQGLADSGS